MKHTEFEEKSKPIQYANQFFKKITYLNKKEVASSTLLFFTNRNGTHLCFLARVIF